MKIYGVMIDFSCKKRSKVCHAYWVNQLKELVETWLVDGVNIAGVPYCGLKGIRKKWRYDTKPSWCQNYAIKFKNKKSAQLAILQPFRVVD